MMSGKDYQLIADSIRTDYEYFNSTSPTLSTISASAVKSVALGLSLAFSKDNSRFNSEKFLEACGIDTGNYSVRT